MLKFRTLDEELLSEISGTECQMLYDFLRLSAHPRSTAQATERELLASLSMAYRSSRATI